MQSLRKSSRKLFVRAVAEKTLNILELVLALILDAALIFVSWSLRKLIVGAVGSEHHMAADVAIEWVISLSDISVITVFAIFILSDILRHLLKAYNDLRYEGVRILSPKR